MQREPKILVVDDSALCRAMITVCIDHYCLCIEAENGHEALTEFQAAAATERPFDLVFMDIIMPEMDGKTALKAIREFQNTQGLAWTPVRMLSASERIDDVANLTSGLLRKPITVQKITEIVEQVAKKVRRQLSRPEGRSL